MKWLCALSLLFASLVSTADRPIVVGSKNFNESYVLAELMAQSLESAGFEVRRSFGLGGTLICYEALRAGEIDVYPEYTGTMAQAIFKLGGDAEFDELESLAAEQALALLQPFGFNNTYAMVVPEALAQARDLNNVSDLVGSDLNIVVSHEFLERADGWPGLAQAYGLSGTPTGIEHGLAYQAIAEGRIDVTDAYSTDGELKRYNLRVLEDDRGFFPRYLAAPLARADLPAEVLDALNRFAGTIDDAGMAALNAEVVFDGATFAEVAASLRAAAGETDVVVAQSESALLRNTLRHLELTGVALGCAVLFGLLLSLAVYRSPGAARLTLAVAGLLQTIPSIALLALMIPLLGIGFLPAVVALFLYSLLPIVRNALTALTTLDPTLVEVANALGLTPRQQLARVYLPMALPSIFAGVRTAAVISIGTATLAAFIGAGGLGEPIVTGLALNNTALILSGAIPAALLALATEGLFELLERALLPAHMRLGSS